MEGPEILGMPLLETSQPDSRAHPSQKQGYFPDGDDERGEEVPQKVDLLNRLHLLCAY